MSLSHFPFFDEETDCITFSSEETSFELEDEEATGKWLRKLIEREGKRLHSLNFIFCSDDYLHQLNVEYLDHDTLTDVITFPYADPPDIAGDVFISIDRIRENANHFGVTFKQELSRVMAHGTLHLCGYGDKTKSEAALMRSKEEEALAMLSA